jgi:hypothetical protein
MQHVRWIPPSSWSSNILVTIYQATRCHAPENHILTLLLKELRVSQLVKKLPASNETQNIYTLFTLVLP